jgi:hypothetical protein
VTAEFIKQARRENEGETNLELPITNIGVFFSDYCHLQQYGRCCYLPRQDSHFDTLRSAIRSQNVDTNDMLRPARFNASALCSKLGRAGRDLRGAAA